MNAALRYFFKNTNSNKLLSKRILRKNYFYNGIQFYPKSIFVKLFTDKLIPINWTIS